MSYCTGRVRHFPSCTAPRPHWNTTTSTTPSWFSTARSGGYFLKYMQSISLSVMEHLQHCCFNFHFTWPSWRDGSTFDFRATTCFQTSVPRNTVVWWSCSKTPFSPLISLVTYSKPSGPWQFCICLHLMYRLHIKTHGLGVSQISSRHILRITAASPLKSSFNVMQSPSEVLPSCGVGSVLLGGRGAEGVATQCTDDNLWHRCHHQTLGYPEKGRLHFLASVICYGVVGSYSTFIVEISKLLVPFFFWGRWYHRQTTDVVSLVAGNSRRLGSFIVFRTISQCFMYTCLQSADLVVAEFLEQGDKEKTVLKIQPQVKSVSTFTPLCLSIEGIDVWLV